MFPSLVPTEPEVNAGFFLSLPHVPKDCLMMRSRRLALYLSEILTLDLSVISTMWSLDQHPSSGTGSLITEGGA